MTAWLTGFSVVIYVFLTAILAIISLLSKQKMSRTSWFLKFIKQLSS